VGECQKIIPLIPFYFSSHSGAGDTFTGGLLHSLMNDFSWIAQAIENGCRLAGFKCGFYGYDCVKNFTFP
jgi:hypothetical protein